MLYLVRTFKFHKNYIRFIQIANNNYLNILFICIQKLFIKMLIYIIIR